MATQCNLSLPEISVEDYSGMDLIRTCICCERMECREASINRANFVARETGGLLR